MKTNFFLLLLFISFTTVLFTSCNNTSDQKKGKTKPEVAENFLAESSKIEAYDNEKPSISSNENNSREDLTTDSEDQAIAEKTPAEEFSPEPEYGKEIYNNTCASCHGISGAGDGVASAGLNPKPRDLSNSEYVSTLSDVHMFKTISEGGAGVGLSPLMPPWKGILTDQQIKDVISHIRTNICKCNSPNKENSHE